MADEQPLQNIPLDDDKRDTVRINLPQGPAGKPPAMPTPTVRLRPPGTAPAVNPSAEHKKATAAISQPALPTKPKKDTAQVATATADSATANPKKDTARVQMPAPKPSVPEMPRPTVKLKREELNGNISAGFVRSQARFGLSRFIRMFWPARRTMTIARPRRFGGFARRGFGRSLRWGIWTRHQVAGCGQ